MKESNAGFLPIDKHNLDVELENQHLLFHKYARRAAKAEALTEDARAEMKRVEAELNIEIRSNPAKFKLPPKLTESLIEAAVRISQRFQVAEKAYLLALRNQLDCQADVKAADQRKWMLEHLCELDSRDYFAEPRVPKEVTETRMRNEEKRLIPPISFPKRSKR